MVDQAARTLLRSLSRWRAVVEEAGGDFRESTRLTDALRRSLEHEVLVENSLPVVGRRGRRWGVQQWRRRAKYLQEKLVKERAEKWKLARRHGARVANHWVVRAGLCDPSLSLRSASDWLCDFDIKDDPNDLLLDDVVGRTSVGRFRDAFAEILLELQGTATAEFASRSRGFFIMTHVHDEACMRLRSQAVEHSDLLARGKSSSTQNNHVLLCLGRGADETQPWVCELQPLRRKTAATLATAVCKVLEGVLATARLSLETRFVHVLVGDGVSSNLLATQLVWGKNHRRQDVQYCCFAMTCSSHAANLCTRTALAGTSGVLPKTDPISGCCVRLFKYLLNDYAEEYTHNLREVVAERLELVPPDVGERLAFARAGHSAARDLQLLYGSALLPESLLELLNGHRAAVSSRQQQPAAASSSQQQPAAASNSQQQVLA